MAPRKTKPIGPSWHTANVALVRLHLDLNNYRHEPLGTEELAIEYLFRHEKVEALARDIAEHGATSPLDRIGVVPMSDNPGHYIAVEGNRRLCALMLLNDPDRAPTPPARAAMRALANEASVPSAVEVVVFSNKNEAKHWIDLRHLGPQEGQGMRTWNTAQKNRAADDGGPDSLALAVLDRAREAGWLEPTQKPAITTLSRYLKNREVRAALGLGHHKELKYTHAEAEVDSALRQFLLDSLPREDRQPPLVHSRSNDADRSTYARELRERGVSPRHIAREPFQPAAAKPAARKQVGERNRPDEALRKHLLPASVVVNAKDSNLRAIFHEFKRTPIDDHEFANAFLLRAFVERLAVCYAQKQDPSFTWRDEHKLLQRCAEWLDPQASKNKFKALRMAVSDKDCAHSLHSLGAAVHAGVRLERRALIAAWANWENAVQAMLAAL